MIRFFATKMQSVSTESSPPLRVERITIDEVEVLSDLADEIWRECYAGLLSAEQIDYMLAKMYAPDQLRHEIERTQIEYFWLRKMPPCTAEPTATCGFLAFGPDENNDGSLFLHKLYLRADSRGRGLAAAALGWLADRASKSSESNEGRCPRISLRVNRGNQRAIRAYQRNGFEISAELCSDIGGGFVMDDYVMGRELATII